MIALTGMRGRIDAVVIGALAAALRRGPVDDVLALERIPALLRALGETRGGSTALSS